MAGAVVVRSLPHRDVRGAEIILHPCIGGHCLVTRNGPTDDLSTKMVEDYCPAWRVIDDEQHGGVKRNVDSLHTTPLCGEAIFQKNIFLSSFFIAGSDRRPVAATRKIARWSRSAARSPDTEIVCPRSGSGGASSWEERDAVGGLGR